MEIEEVEEDVFYYEDEFPLKCCEKCSDVHYEKTYPAHTTYLACRNLKCECHKNLNK